MKGVPLTRASAFAPFVRFLSEIGTPRDSLLAKVGLPGSALSEPDADALIPMHQVCTLLDIAAREQGVEHLGFLVGERTSLLSLGGLGQLIAQSTTLHEALNTVVRVLPAYVTDGPLRLASDGKRTWLLHTQDRRLERGSQQLEQYHLMLMIQLVRLTAEREWRPQRVWLRAPRGVGLEKLEALSNARISFGHASTCIEIPRVLLQKPLGVTKSRVFAKGEIERDLHLTAPAGDFPGSVRQVVGMFLRDSYPKVQRTASAVGMSLRTFQRRLAESGVNYSRIVEEERCRVAAELITHSRLSVTDIAMELGYTDSTNFAHAFHRWTGLSPSQYRRREVGPSILLPNLGAVRSN